MSALYRVWQAMKGERKQSFSKAHKLHKDETELWRFECGKTALMAQKTSQACSSDWSTGDLFLLFLVIQNFQRQNRLTGDNSMTEFFYKLFYSPLVISWSPASPCHAVEAGVVVIAVAMGSQGLDWIVRLELSQSKASFFLWCYGQCEYWVGCGE